MEFMFSFFLNSILLGIGLAMDAFSVSLANGLSEPNMKVGRMSLIAGIFAVFQFCMPMIGWICVSTIAQYFVFFQKCIPWIALVLLGYIGAKMLHEGLHHRDSDAPHPAVDAKTLLMQGIATSIDALSVGFTISGYRLHEALLSCLLIGAVTFLICLAGLAIGRKAGTKLASKSGILGGAILIFIGLEIFITHLF